MSQENVEVVQAICDAYARGDYEAALERLDEDIEFVSPPDITGGGEVWRGREGTRQGVTTFLGTWEDYHYEARKLIDCGDEVLVEGWQRARGRGSGVDVSESIYSVWTVRGGRVIRQRMFRDRGQALDAVGQSE
jgi:ketosteroid isomerase-like protein